MNKASSVRIRSKCLSSGALLASVLTLACSYPPSAESAEKSWELFTAATQFQRVFLTSPDALERIKANGNLSGKDKQGKGQAVSGWFEYDFSVPATGWHQLFVEPSGGGHEFRLDDMEFFQARGDSLLGSFWLKGGSHTLRIQRMVWTGLGGITGWRIRALAPGQVDGAFRISVEDNRTLLRQGEELRLRLTGGAAPGQTAPMKFVLQMFDNENHMLSQQEVSFPPGENPTERLVGLSCTKAGEFTVRCFLDGKELKPPAWPGVHGLAIDTSPRASTGRSLRKELIAEVDCAVTAPDYHGGGETRVVKRPFGAYRESGELGWLQFQDETHPCWFAYKFTAPEAQKPYYFEVDYPDDARRTFCLSVREGVPGSYPTTAGVDAGGEFNTSGGMLTHGVLHWARGKDLRLVCVTPQTGYRAAAARIRLFSLPDGLPQMRAPSFGGRGFGNWYEEGGSLMGIFAAPNTSLSGSAVAAERWARSIAWIGGDTLMYTMAVYQFGLYPSRYNTSFTSPFSADVVGTIVLACEKYGLKFVGEFHPEARDLSWPESGRPVCPDGNRSVSKDGKTGERLLSPLYPRNKEWYTGMVKEFAGRYKDSPAFYGVSLRLMGWVNPGLNNFESADWGYDDYTVNLFAKESGLDIPGGKDDPERFQKRHKWLKDNAWEKWLDWRCAQITSLHKQIAEDIRAIRADLKLFIQGEFKDLRGAGIDPAALEKIPGVLLLGGGSYGRRGRSLKEMHEQREALTNPDLLKRLCAPGSPGNFLFGAGYFEGTEVVVPPADLGFDPKMKRSWTSGVVNPAGRNYLERYAVALAEADAQFLADGGNAYTLGQPELQEFLGEYRYLPPMPFAKRGDASDPVAVWEARTDRDFYFYAVNRENYPVTIQLDFTGQGQINRLATGEAVALSGNRVSLSLRPFQLLTFSASTGMVIEKARAIVPDEVAARGRRLAAWAREHATAASERDDLSATQKTLLEKTAVAIEECLRTGHYWLQRTRLEAPALQEIYQTTLEYPPMPYPRPELGQLKGKGNFAAWETRYPQADLNQPGSLTDCLRTAIGPGVTATIPEQEFLGPLATWKGAEAELRLPFPVLVPQRFRVWARLAGGKGCAGFTLTDASGKAQTIPSGSAPGLHVPPPVEIGLRPGEGGLRLAVSGEGATYLDQIYLEPLTTPIESMAFAAYFPNPGQENWEKPLPPESPEGQKMDAVFKGTDGIAPKEVRWAPYPAAQLGANHSFGANNGWKSVKCPPGPLGKEVVGYCRTVITAPTERKALLTFSATSQIRLWLNGELVVDSVSEKLDLIWWRGSRTREVSLKAGENILLVKLGNAGNSNPDYYRLIAFAASITDPGDLRIGTEKPAGPGEKREP